MIYTVTFNPAIDYVMKIDSLILGHTNRTSYEQVYFGGKGINVSLVLSQLGITSTALGFVAGFTGDALTSEIQKSGVITDFIRLENSLTRINVKLKGEKETEINAQGPFINEEKLQELFKKLDSLVFGDTLVLAGSVPSSVSEDVYARILERLQNKGIRFVVDATKRLLIDTLKYKPFLIKPNIAELEEIFGKKLTNEEEIIECAKILQSKGAKNVLVSRGEDGAILIDENNKIHRRDSKCKECVNSVGAGDSMVAGFIAGSSSDYATALEYGIAAGGATACSEGLASKEMIDRFLQMIDDNK